MVCVTGPSAYEKTDIVQVDVDQSGMGTSKESFSYLVSSLWTSTELFFLSLPPHSHSSTLPLVSCSQLGKSSQVCQLSVNRCILWVRGMQVCGNLQTLIWAANKHHCHSELAASKNKYVDCWMSLCSELIIGQVEPASIVLMNPNPHSLPLDLQHSVSGNTQVRPLFLFICRQRVFS